MSNWYERKRLIIESFYDKLSAQDKIEWATHRRACNKSLFFFIKEVGGYMPMSGGDISPIIHKPILDRWQDPHITRQACYMPRSWKKSTTLSQWANGWEYLQNNEIRILMASEKEDKVIDWILWIEEQILKNPRLRWLYPELTVVDQSYTMKVRWSGKKCLLPRAGVYPEPTISAIGIRGGAQGGHYDILNIDDAVGEKGIESELVLQDAERWFDNCEGLLLEKDPTMPNASRVRVVGTHWATGDMGHYIQKNYKEYKWMIVPCLKDSKLEDSGNVQWIQHPDVGEGESNWPEMFSTQIYTDMINNPEQELTFWSQYMNNPRLSNLNPLDAEWFKYYRIEDRDGHKFLICLDDKEEFRLGSFPLHGYIDPGGFSDKRLTKKSSRFAVMHGGQPNNTHKKFVTYAKAFRFKEPDKSLDEVFKAHEFFKPVVPVLWRQEIFGQQKYILMDIRKEAQKRHIPMRIVELESDESKDAKAMTIDALKSPMYSGDIYIHESMKDLINETKLWPNGLTNDLLELLSKLNKYTFKRGGVKEEAKPISSRAVYGKSSESSRTGY